MPIDLHVKCILAGYMVTQETTRRLQKILDPLSEKFSTKNTEMTTLKKNLFFFLLAK